MANIWQARCLGSGTTCLYKKGLFKLVYKLVIIHRRHCLYFLGYNDASIGDPGGPTGWLDGQHAHLDLVL